jgi:hypothetical protein
MMKGKLSRLAIRRLVASAVLILGIAGATSSEVWAGSEVPPLPAKSRAIIHFDLQRLKESEIFRDALQHIDAFAQSDEKLQMFLQATGLTGATASIKGFTIYSFSEPGAPQAFAGVVEADFGAETMGRLERAYAPVAREVRGKVIMPVIETPDIEIVMSFLGPQRLSFGTAQAVEMVTTGMAADPELLNTFKRTVTQRPIWGIVNARGLIGPYLEQMKSKEGDAEALQLIAGSQALSALSTAGFSMDVGRDIFFELRAFTDTPDNARLLADAVKGAAAMAQLGVSQTDDPDLVDFVRNIVAISERDSVYVSFVVTTEQIRRLQTDETLFPQLIP